MRLITSLASLVVVLWAGLQVAAENQDAKDAVGVVGSWKPVSAEMDGKALQFPADDKSLITFTADGKFTIKLDFLGGREDAKRGTYKLKRHEKIMQIDMVFPEDKKDYLVRGIFAVTGDNLKLCLGNEDSSLPTEFKAPKGADVMINLVLKRGKK